MVPYIKISTILTVLISTFAATEHNKSLATDRLGDSHASRGASPFVRSTIVSFLPPGFQPGLLYQVFPVDEFVGPGDDWQLAVGFTLTGAPPSLEVSLRFADPENNPDLQITGDMATFVTQAGLLHNFDSLQRFELFYSGTQSPFVGAIDLVLEPTGFPEIPVRVQLHVSAQSGFPIPIQSGAFDSAPIGNITGDSKLEILFSASLEGEHGLFALDHAGNILPGWPLVSGDPTLSNEDYKVPNLVDLTGDGLDEVVVVGSATREARGTGSQRGTVSVRTLTVADGSGAILWRKEEDFESFSIPAVADLDADGDLDLVVAGLNNLKRFESDGTPLPGWQVETSDDIHVYVPVIADVDGDPGNGLEIAACASNFAPQAPEQVYVWNQNGELLGPGWPVEMDGDCRPVAVADLDSDPGNGLEIILGIDHFPNPPVDPETGFLHTVSVFAWHADGSPVDGWPYRHLRDPKLAFSDDRVLAGAIVGDLDGNGDLEVVIGTYGQGDPANGNLFVLHHDGTPDPHWPRWAGIAQTPSAWGGQSLGDLDGDGLLEIVTASFKGLYAFRADGELFEGFPRLSADNFGQPMIADLDADGRLEIVEVSVVDGLVAYQLAIPANHPRLWSRFRQNPGNTGALPLQPAIGLPAWNETGGIVAMAMWLLLGALLIRGLPRAPALSRAVRSCANRQERLLDGR